MGRWGDEIYESDSTLDFLGGVTDIFERELAYWTAPEQVRETGHWLSFVLPVIEMILLFERHKISRGVYLEQQETAIQRWKETILKVWDSDWREESVYRFPYENPDYRKQHRHLVVQMFDHLNDVALYWSAENFPDNQFPLLSSDHPLPFFSIRWLKNQDGTEEIRAESFVNIVMSHLKKEIVYALSFEMREMAFSYVEDVWAAVDLLGLLAEVYQKDIGVHERFVRQWRETAIQIEKQGEDNGDTYPDVIRAFDRLEAMAKKYFQWEW